jgi:hypothetical protein
MEQNKPEFKLLLLLLLTISAIGAINWGLVGIWNFDLVLYFFSTKPGYYMLNLHSYRNSRVYFNVVAREDTA